MKEDIYWIWLSRLKLKPIILKQLLERYKSPKNIWNLSKEQLIKDEIHEDISNEILNLEYRKNINRYINYMKNNNIEWINIFDKDYPNNLKNIYDSPIVLYLKGEKKILNDLSIAIVGCRNCSRYGEIVARKISYELAKANINIISGLARGIDTSAHIGAINAKGKTIAVLGSGIDSIYPKENTKLADEIINTGGCIVSEYIIGTKPEKENFPRRNRIISGLSNGVLVVEAKEKSGTFITVDFALEQGKEVYAVPREYNELQFSRYKHFDKRRRKTCNGRRRYFRRHYIMLPWRSHRGLNL